MMRTGMQAAALAMCAAILSSTAALAAPSNSTNQARLDRTVRFLQEAQNSDGGFGGEKGQESSQLFSAWVALALAGAAVNPQDQAKPGGTSVYSYLAEHVAHAIRTELCAPSVCTTAFERELLVVDASGTSPHDFGGIDLVSELLARELPDGSFPFVPGGHGEVNDTIFAILSLSPIAEPVVQEAIQHAAKWVIEQQNKDGSWAWESKGSPGESDMTGAAIEALNAAGLHGTEAQQKAIGYLHQIQGPDGGFPEFPSEEESNSGSTAWVVQGIWAAGENPETWTKGSRREPLDYLESMQQPDGHIRYRVSEELNGVWMTAYTGPAYAGQPLPISAPPRNPNPSTPPSSSGQGGESGQSGSGVIAGGGGDGAPLFSRPQPGSKGHNPGGAQLLKREHVKAKHRRNPGSPHNTGSPRKRPVIAIASSSSHRSKKSSDYSARSGTVQLIGASASKGDSGGGRVQEPEIKGVLIGAPADALAAGAPGLHSASAGSKQASWFTVAMAAALLLSFLFGAQLEHRGSEVTL
jgi:prenyltransferase beta subunit